LSGLDKEKLLQALMQVSEQEIDQFMDVLRDCLERYITKIILIPLFGKKYEFKNVGDALNELNTIDIDNPRGDFERFEIIIDYSNNDTIRASFQDKARLTDFLKKLEN
jgi:hypothetical protein